jgi:prolyl oligopeptidase
MKLLLVLIVSILILSSQLAIAQYLYPTPKKILQVETRFGVQIEDPYKWMENPSDPDLWSWIDKQKSFTTNYLDSHFMDAFAARTLEIRKLRSEQGKVTEAANFNATPSANPWTEEDLYLMGRSEKRFIKWTADSKTNFKSTSTKTESATYKLTSQAVYSGDLLRIIITQKSDNKVVDILMVKFYQLIAWEDDNSFYYVSDLDERNGGGRPALFKHTVGQTQSEDQLLLVGKFSNSNLVIHQVGNRFFAELDETISSLQLSTGKISNQIAIKGDIVEVSDGLEIDAVVRSFDKANNGELYKLRLRDGARRIFLKEQDFVIEKSKKLNESSTFIYGLKDGANVAGILTSNGLKMISGLEDGTIDVVSIKDDVLKLGFENFSTPRKVFSYNLLTEELRELAAQAYPIEVEFKKIFYTASNGQQASMFVIWKKGTELSSTTPTILFGYGGFKISITPGFGMYESLPWLEKGGAFVVVSIPGSLDYGFSWWDIARNGGRVHSWDSFALAAKELFKRGWTSPDHVGILGASNGGTLVAGTLERHPEVFKAAVPIVGVMDLINFPLFTAGKYWTEDFGNPFNEKEFKNIFPLSPYHALSKKNYPATLVMTAEFDDRVVPMHSYKYAARLQEYNTSEAPMLLYNKEWGAHGRASGPSRESSRFVAAFYTFFAQQLGL